MIVMYLFEETITYHETLFKEVIPTNVSIIQIVHTFV